MIFDNNYGIILHISSPRRKKTILWVLFEVILMSTHNISFFEEWPKKFFQLSLNKMILNIYKNYYYQYVQPILMKKYEPCYEKTGFLHMRKQRRRSASR